LTILPARGELGALLRRPAGLQATIDQVAMPPPVQARFGDPQRSRHLADGAAWPDQIEGTTAKFGRVWSRHRLFPRTAGHQPSPDTHVR